MVNHLLVSLGLYQLESQVRLLLPHTPILHTILDLTVPIPLDDVS